MRFSVETLTDFTLGCDHIEDAGGAIRFCRLTPPLSTHYAQFEFSNIRMKCPAGIHIRFMSTTRNLSLGMGFGERAREIFHATCLVDDAVFVLGPDTAVPTWSGSIPALPDNRMRVFDLWLPHMAISELLFLEIDNEASVTEAPPPTYRWLVYGDSITQGMTVPLPHETHIARVSRTLNMDAHSLAIGGATLEPILAETVPDEAYDVCSVAYGVNDFNQGIPVATFIERMEKLLATITLKHPKVPILLITPTPTELWDRPHHNSNEESADDFRAALEVMAHDMPQVTCLHGPNLIPAESENFADSLHPNEIGAAIYAERLTDAMRGVLA